MEAVTSVSHLAVAPVQMDPEPKGRVERVDLLDLSFDPLTLDEATEQCIEWCLSRPGAGSRLIITANAAILCMMRRDPALASACQSGELVLADGMSVVWGLRMAGAKVPERVTGVDLMGRLLRRGAKERLRVYLLGARPNVVAKLASLCESRHPGIIVVGKRDGYFGEDDHPAIIEDIRKAQPHLLLVGMPTPFKEVWCHRHREALGVPVILGVGGSFDVHAGFVRRAPAIFQRLGLEWSWRLLMEPRKLWRRYLTTNVEFLWLVGRELLTKKLGLFGSKGRLRKTVR